MRPNCRLIEVRLQQKYHGFFGGFCQRFCGGSLRSSAWAHALLLIISPNLWAKQKSMESASTVSRQRRRRKLPRMDFSAPKRRMPRQSQTKTKKFCCLDHKSGYPSIEAFGEIKCRRKNQQRKQMTRSSRNPKHFFVLVVATMSYHPFLSRVLFHRWMPRSWRSRSNEPWNRSRRPVGAAMAMVGSLGMTCFAIRLSFCIKDDVTSVFGLLRRNRYWPIWIWKNIYQPGMWAIEIYWSRLNRSLWKYNMNNRSMGPAWSPSWVKEEKKRADAIAQHSRHVCRGTEWCGRCVWCVNGNWGLNPQQFWW